MAWYENPAFGIYDDDDRYDRGNFGVSESKNQGDGFWCPWCHDNGIYMWANFIERNGQIERYKCQIHGTMTKTLNSQDSGKG